MVNFLLINICGGSVEKHVQTTWCELKLLFEGLECYKHTQVKACDSVKFRSASTGSVRVKCGVGRGYRCSTGT